MTKRFGCIIDPVIRISRQRGLSGQLNHERGFGIQHSVVGGGFVKSLISLFQLVRQHGRFLPTSTVDVKTKANDGIKFIYLTKLGG